VARVWGFEDMHRFAAAAGRHEAMVRVLADCGLRIGELLALRREDLSAGILAVKRSGWEGRIVESSEVKNHDREVPVPPGCLALIGAMPTRIDTPWLFPTATGKMWRHSNWRRTVWLPACEAAGIAPTPHEFRHSYVTHLRAAGVDPADLADVAGHSVQTATSRYTHPLRRSFDEIRTVVGA
jgi:integrase